MDLRIYLYQNAIDPEEFAKRLGIGVASIYRYMSGKRANHRIAYKIQIATQGQVTVEELTKK